MHHLLRAAVLAVLLAATGCGGEEGTETATGRAGDSSGETPTPGGTVYRHLESDCRSLNWVLFNTKFENYVLRYLYDYLLDYDANLEIQPVLASDYEVSKDNLRITIHLKDGLRWHDGTPITSEDVKFTVDMIRDPAVPAVNKEGWFSELDDVETVDEKTVVFIWKRPYAPALHALTQLAPIPKHIYDVEEFEKNPANRAPIGSGAFKFEEWKTGHSITLIRNDDYYGQPAYVDKVVFRIIPDQAVALNALKIGEIDEMRVKQVQWERQTNDSDFLKKFNKELYYVPQYNYIAWNCRSAYFSDRRVRRAMTMLFDRKSVIEELYSGYAKAVSGPFYIRSKAYNGAVEPYPYDPERAKELLEEAGWIDRDGDGLREKDGVDFRFELSASTSRIASDFAQLLQEECAKVGIEMTIKQTESSTFFDRVFKGEYVAAILAWRLDLDPDIFDTFHSSQVPPIGLNHGFYSNAEVDSLLERGRVEFDPERRLAIYHEVHRLIHEDQPYTFINSVPEKRTISKRIGNVVVSPDGPFNFYPGAIYWYIKSDVMEAKQ